MITLENGIRVVEEWREVVDVQDNEVYISLVGCESPYSATVEIGYERTVADFLQMDDAILMAEALLNKRNKEDKDA